MTKAFKEKVRKFKTNLNLLRTLRLIWSVTNGRVALMLLLVIAESVFFFASLYMFKHLINAVAHTGNDKVEVITKYLLVAASLSVIYLVIRAITAFITEKQSAKVSEHIDNKLHTSAIDLDLAFYESPAYFDTMKRAKDAGPDKPNAILTNLVDISKNGMMLVVMGFVLISISWLLLPLLAVFIIPTLVVRIRYAGQYYQWRRIQTPLERKSSYLSSLITEEVTAKEIRAFGLGNYLRSLYMNIRTGLVNQRLKMAGKNAINEIITTTLAALGMFACIGYICISAAKGNTTIGDISLFLVVFPQLFNVMQALSGGISTLYHNSIFMNNVFEMFDLKSDFPEPEYPLPVPEKDVDLEVQNLDFTYAQVKGKTLSNISLKIPAGKIVAVVGLNGAGKTTLIKLLSRLYDPSNGRIQLGNIDIREFNSAEYRKQISVVFQDFAKYNMSVKENIRFGNIDEDLSDEEIKIAAVKSGAHEFIKKLPAGYDTIMGRIFEDGHEVSIGQWQKLAIARAFYSNSRFLIFDEATSALDAKAEQELFESLRDHIGNRGILVISHRLSAVKHADHIYVMAEGKIKQHGTHEELMATAGEYSKLFSKKTVVI